MDRLQFSEGVGASHRARTRGLPPADTIRAYETIYFPAQKIHFQRDDPKSAATMIFDNNQAKVGGAPYPGRR